MADELSKTLQLLADDTRFQIVRILGAGPATVTELVNSLHLGQSLVSYHLSLMKDAGLVTTTTKGKWRIYSLNSSIRGNAKTLVELIAGSEVQDVEGGDTSARERASRSPSRKGPETEHTRDYDMAIAKHKDDIPTDDRDEVGRKEKKKTSRSSKTEATGSKPQVEDFEDYLL
jgi:ArsR family transcriptional regulator